MYDTYSLYHIYVVKPMNHIGVLAGENIERSEHSTEPKRVIPSNVYKLMHIWCHLVNIHVIYQSYEL